MYCKNCGRAVDDNSLYCYNCGARLDNTSSENISEDNSSFGFAVLGFFIPIAGFILFLIYEGKKPKRAKSAGKGALIGFITKIVLSIILIILYVVFAASLLRNIDDMESKVPVLGDTFKEETTEMTETTETTDKILEKYVDVSFGEFKVSSNGYYDETSLDVTAKNISDKQYTFYITIEAVDENGDRLGTDIIFADRLNAGQSISMTAFEYIDKDKIDDFRNASFKVLDIQYYNYN